MADYTAPRGTRDVLPSESAKWQFLEEMFRKACALHGYRELRTPTFEHTELFTRNLGETTDVVSKEMYTFETRGGKSLTLRPEGTAPAIRAFVEHGLSGALPVTKLYYVARLFRYERPQAGRYREHTQLGVEALGATDPAIDAEVISLAATFFASVGVGNAELKLNSIGCPECRPGYREALKSFAGDRVSELCPTCATRYEQNPLRMLDCKVPSCKQILADAPKMTDHLCEDCKGHFESVKKYLTALGITYTLDPKLVRGFDYYTKTAFEFVSGELGAQNAVGGGGRYDNLVKEIGGPDTPGIGFGLGMERLLLTLEAMGVELPCACPTDVYVIGLGANAHEAAVKLVADLRASGLAADMDYTGRSMKSQMKVVDKLGARFAAILGDDEIAGGFVSLRDMRSSEQKQVMIADLAETLLSF